MSGALSDITVVAFTHRMSGPLAAQYLGALGADVVKVEPPTGDFNRHILTDPRRAVLKGAGPYFLNLNRNQRSVVLNLKSSAGRAAAMRLIARADVLIENHKPGTFDRLGFGYGALRDLHPRLVYCSISAYDPFGPAREAPGQDLLIQALSGIASLTGPASGAPVAVGTYAVDAYTASQAVIGILAALRHRDRSGVGQWVCVNMMSAAVHMMASEAGYMLNVDAAAVRGRSYLAHIHQAAPYGIYPTNDGAVAIVTPVDPEMIEKIAACLGLSEELRPYLTKEKLLDRRDDVALLLAQGIASISKAEAIERMAKTGAWIVPVRSVGEALADPAIVATGMIESHDSAYAGPHRVVTEPIRLTATPVTTSRPAPGPGEHTREVLAELGYDKERIDSVLREAPEDAGA